MAGVSRQLGQGDRGKVAWQGLRGHEDIDHEAAFGEGFVEDHVRRLHARAAVVVDGLAEAAHDGVEDRD